MKNNVTTAKPTYEDLKVAYENAAKPENLDTNEMNRMIDDLKSDADYYKSQYNKYFTEAMKYRSAFKALVEELLVTK